MSVREAMLERLVERLEGSVERLWEVVNRHSTELSDLSRELRADNDSLFRRVQLIEDDWREDPLFLSIEKVHQRYQDAIENKLPLTPRSIEYMRSSNHSDEIDDLPDEEREAHKAELRTELIRRKKRAMESLRQLREKKRLEEERAVAVKEERERELERIRSENYHFGKA